MLQARAFETALKASERAVTLDPQIVDAWAMVVRLQAALGNREASRAGGLSANPGDDRLLSLQ